MPEQTDEPPKQDFVPIEPPGAGREPAASANCGNISGRAAIPRCGRTAKKHSRNVYAKTRAECEEKLKVLILEMKRRSPLSAPRKYGIPRRGESQKEGHRRLPAGAPRRVQQVLNRQGIADGPLHGAAGTTMRSDRSFKGRIEANREHLKRKVFPVLMTIDGAQSMFKYWNLPMFAEPFAAPAYETNAPVVHNRELRPVMPGKLFHCLAGSHVVLPGIQNTDGAVPIMDRVLRT